MRREEERGFIIKHGSGIVHWFHANMPDPRPVHEVLRRRDGYLEAMTVLNS